MLIVIAIIGIITLVVITSQSAFNKSLILSNAAYDLALAVRGAQVEGVGSRLGTGAVTNVGYGLYFTPNASTFTLFADASPPVPSASGCHGLPEGGEEAPDAKIGDCVYSPNPPNQDPPAITTYVLNRGIVVSLICARNPSGNKCSNRGELSDLAVSFVRPDPRPFFAADGRYDATISRACVTLASPQGGERSVVVTATGEIDAAAASCP